MGKEYASRGSNAESKKEAERISEEGFVAMESLFTKYRGVLIDLVDITRKLRELPKLDLGISTLALVGAPNVGKSSLVQIISSGRPEICNYPFTTRSIKMGHFYVDGQRHQVTDTPGLLNRPEDEKNSLELLTMATLRHLPTAVVFVVDATEECGTCLEDQLAIRAHLKESFPSKSWIDVFSKLDLLIDSVHQAENAVQGGTKQVEALRKLHGAVKVSSVTQEGVDVFKERVMQLFSETVPLAHSAV